jgi:hypothetical protein
LAQAGTMPTILTRRLHRQPLEEFRQQLPALLDADEFDLV